MPVKKLKVTPKKADGLTIDVFDIKGKVVEEISLSKEIFGSKANDALVAQAVRVYLANQRSGSASTKTRGEVSGSTRKIYRQKGTGRARHGGIRAPIFIKGGIALGPKPRDFSLELPKNMRRKALFSVLSQKYKDGEIKIVKGLEKISPKTKSFALVVGYLKVDPKKRVLLVLPQISENVHIVKAARNIQGVSYTQASQLNTYEVLHNSVLLFTKDAISSTEKTFITGEKQ